MGSGKTHNNTGVVTHQPQAGSQHSITKGPALGKMAKSAGAMQISTGVCPLQTLFAHKLRAVFGRRLAGVYTGHLQSGDMGCPVSQYKGMSSI